MLLIILWLTHALCILCWLLKSQTIIVVILLMMLSLVSLLSLINLMSLLNYCLVSAWWIQDHTSCQIIMTSYSILSILSAVMKSSLVTIIGQPLTGWAILVARFKSSDSLYSCSIHQLLQVCPTLYTVYLELDISCFLLSLILMMHICIQVW